MATALLLASTLFLGSFAGFLIDAHYHAYDEY